MKRIVIVSRMRFITFLFFVFILGSLLMAAVFNLNMARSCDSTERPSYVASKNDTLWSIAEKYCNGEDVRQTVYDIKKINSLKTSEVREGQTLVLPY